MTMVTLSDPFAHRTSDQDYVITAEYMQTLQCKYLFVVGHDLLTHDPSRISDKSDPWPIAISDNIN